MKKYQNFYLKIFIFFGSKICSVFEKACFRNAESLDTIEWINGEWRAVASMNLNLCIVCMNKDICAWHRPYFPK